MNALIFGNAITRIEDNFVASVQAAEDLGLAAAGATRLHGYEYSATVTDRIGSPVIAVAKEGRHGHFEDLSFFPDDDAGFDAEIIAEGRAGGERRDDIGDDVDPLFLNSERGNFCEGGGLD